MKWPSNEIKTGLMVVLTLGLLVFVIIKLVAPTVFRPMDRFEVYFDNAAGIRPGAQVTLAGRSVGQVETIYSPVAPEERPEGHPDYEVKITILVQREAVVYSDVDVKMVQLSMLGDRVIDMSGGSASAGDAQDGAVFVGERVPDFSDLVPATLEMLKPVAESATETLDQLQVTAQRLTDMTESGSELMEAIDAMGGVMKNLEDLTGQDGSIQEILANLEELSRQLAEEDRVSKILANLEHATAKVDSLLESEQIEGILTNVEVLTQEASALTVRLDRTITLLEPELESTAMNLSQMTDTLKRQPWRLIWPSTKQYPEEDEIEEVDVERRVPDRARGFRR